MSIPIPNNHHKDKFIWGKEEKGVYTVKSSYRSLMGEDNLDVKVKWTNIGKLPLLPKVKVLIWQACCNVLPTTDNLNNRRVDCHLLCILCTQEDEITDHIFLHCEVAKSC